MSPLRRTCRPASLTKTPGLAIAIPKRGPLEWQYRPHGDRIDGTTGRCDPELIERGKSESGGNEAHSREDGPTAFVRRVGLGRSGRGRRDVTGNPGVVHGSTRRRGSLQDRAMASGIGMLVPRRDPEFLDFEVIEGIRDIQEIQAVAPGDRTDRFEYPR